MIRVLCARSMQAAVTALARPLAGDLTPDIVFEPMGALQARLLAGGRADVLVLSAPAIDALAAAGRMLGGTRTAIARAPIGVAAADDGTPAADISTANAFVRALENAGTIALSDPAVGGSAGTYLRQLFERIGLAGMVAAKTVHHQSGAAAAGAVGRGAADLAVTFVPELLQATGVRILGPLPPPYGHATAYAAAVPADCDQAGAAQAFIRALTAPAAAAVWAAAGFEVGPQDGSP